MKYIKDASKIKLPETFKCPICVGKVVITEITEWEEAESGECLVIQPIGI